jgi:hypothetical protein
MLAACTPLPIAIPVPTPTPAEANNDPAAAAQYASSAAADLYPAAAPIPVAETLAGRMAAAANTWLDALGDGRAQAHFDFADVERVRWHWTTPSGFPRNGLALKAQTPEQASLAFTLLQTGCSPLGYEKARAIMALQVDLGNDPQRYYVSIFGEPGGNAPWGWRWEGHHLSRHITVQGDQITMTPFFLGAWPTETETGLRAMPREEDAARELVMTLPAEQRSWVIFQEQSLTRHVTQNQPQVSAPEPVGLPLGEFTPAHQALADEIIQTYLGSLPAEIGGPLYQRIEMAGRADIRFGWAGSLEPRQPHYYRLQGASFLLEFDNSRNRGTHIHSVWRDYAGDFGGIG